MNELVPVSAIEAARERIRGGLEVTPCSYSRPLSELTGSEIYCKYDHLQRTGSFKERGARNALLALDDAGKARGVIAASAGNHALGLAWHGSLLNIPVTVVMPRFAPLIKVETCRRFGARVVLYGGTFGEARDEADRLTEAEGLVYINGYDDPEIIEGQGTMALEVLEQVPDLDAMVVPIGGGGLIAGVARVMKARRPEVLVVGVEGDQVASWHAAIEAGAPVPAAMQPSLADGLAVPTVGENAFRIARDLIDRLVCVDEARIALAILRIIELEKSVVEGAAASSLAALLSGACPELKGKKVVLPFCGGNIDPTVLSRIIQKGLAADGRICRLSALISDRPGGLARATAIIAETGAGILDVYHDRTFSGPDVSAVRVVCTVETRNREHIQELLAAIRKKGIEVEQV